MALPVSDVVSLSRFRKARKRAEDEARAAQNRVVFGRTKAERSLRDAEKALIERQAIQNRIEIVEKSGS
jgi:hypothetical protein